MRVESSIWHPLKAGGGPLCLQIKRHSSGKYNFVADVKPLQLVVNLPDTSKNNLQGNVMLFDAKGCVWDPMLQEF